MYGVYMSLFLSTPKLKTIAVLLLCSAAASAQASNSYTLTDLGALYPEDVNDHGDVVGFHGTGNGFGAFLYSNGQTTELSSPTGGQSWAYAINNNGQTIGWYSSSESSWQGTPFLFSAGQMSTLGEGDGYASAINDSGHVLVNFSGSDVTTVYHNGVVTAEVGQLFHPFGAAYGNDINDNGQITGRSAVSDGSNFLDDHAFLYGNGSAIDLGTLGGMNSEGIAINAIGQVVGNSEIDPSSFDEHAFLYSNGVMSDLGTLNGGYSDARDINDNGQVVGESDGHAFLFSNGSMIDLNTLIAANSGFELFTAAGINNAGQIVGYGVRGDELRGFLLTPTAVPVPTAAWLFSSGLIALLGSKRRRLIA